MPTVPQYSVQLDTLGIASGGERVEVAAHIKNFHAQKE
jgi:hypothetical protein